MSSLKKYIFTLGLLSIAPVISGCMLEDNHSASDTPSLPLGGDPYQFYDLPVSGLRYYNGQDYSVTDETGTFYWDGSSELGFSIGYVYLGCLQADDKAGIKPLADNGGANVRINLLRLLMTVDEDHDAWNGIQIPDALKNATGNVSLTADFGEFGQQTAVTAMIGDNRLLSAEEAEGIYTRILFHDYVGHYELSWGFLIGDWFPIAVSDAISFDVGDDGKLHTGGTVINASIDPHDDYRLRLTDLSFLILIDLGFYELDIDANIDPDRTIHGKAIARNYKSDDAEGAVWGGWVE